MKHRKPKDKDAAVVHSLKTLESEIERKDATWTPMDAIRAALVKDPVAIEDLDSDSAPEIFSSLRSHGYIELVREDADPLSATYRFGQQGLPRVDYVNVERPDGPEEKVEPAEDAIEEPAPPRQSDVMRRERPERRSMMRAPVKQEEPETFARPARRREPVVR